ncbi:MAG: hypothetical protein HYZ53_28460 [Planctomycetes bacterium]|nr:hypothetical protein [Planctomycetota bacterium]
MSRKRRNEAPPITLFSFQDILTSLTGILILIALLLAIDVLSRRGSSSPSSDETARPGPSPEELRARKAVLEQALRTLPEPSAGSPAAVLARDSIPAGELPRRIQEETQRASALEVELRQTEDAARRTEETIETAGRVSQAASSQRAVRQARLSELEGEAARLGRGQVIHFLPGERGGARPILVECSRSGFRVCFSGAGGETKEITEEDAVTIQAPIRRLLAWIQGRDRAAEYLVLFVKPSAAAYFGDLLQQLRPSEWTLGYEALEEEKSVVLAPIRKD